MSTQNADPEDSAADFQALLDADIDGLLDAPEVAQKMTSADRLERAFLEIVDFRRNHGRLPSSATRTIAERKLGARLEGTLADEGKAAALQYLDTEFGLLTIPGAPESLDDLLESDELDELLGDTGGILDVSDLPARRAADAPDSVAKRKKALDFDNFEHLFKAKHSELADGTMVLAGFKGVQSIQEGRFFVLNGVMLFVAEIGESQSLILGGKAEQKQRLRVIFENGTESALYRQSLSIRLHEQEGQALVNAGAPAEDILDADAETGHIYVLKSLSEDPLIAGIADLHKIGFSTGSVEKRIRNATKSPTYLMAPVKVLEDYRTYNLKASALEHLLHRVFADVRLPLTQVDLKGRDYDPSEWFIAPRKVIDQAINMIMSGEITDYVYDPASQRLVELE